MTSRRHHHTEHCDSVAATVLLNALIDRASPGQPALEELASVAGLPLQGEPAGGRSLHDQPQLFE